jgi:hypothetical protein
MAQIDTLTNVGAVVATDLVLILRGGANVLGTIGSLVGQNANAVAITGGSINGTLGATTRSTVRGTTGDFSGTVTVGVNGRIRESSDDLHVGNGITNIRFFDTEDRVIPVLADGTPSDGATSFGRSSHRFKDILLSGVVSAGTATISGVVTIGDGHTIGDDAFDNLKITSSAGENLILDGGALLLYIGGVESARVDASRNLLVGATATPTGAADGISIGNSGLIITSNAATNTQTHHQFLNPNGVVGTITTNGSATAYNTSSDPRLKSDFVKASGALDLIVEAHDNEYFGVFYFLSNPTVPVLGYNSHKLIDNQPGYGGTEGVGPRDLAIGEEYEAAVYEDQPVFAERPTFDADDKQTGVEQYDTGRTESVEVEPAKTVQPAGVDQSKRVPLLEAAIYELLQMNGALTQRIEQLEAA